ncbi:unnamed protein product [Phyllotreta striolata]|uniref:Chorein N-terminal domain-containing protein n=1 Tax=Phyllotreta striolata TaxID=444603 RepID=A0A9N9TTT7_PHYSR|nr:unnamed protein product [Phyllotreta striolata]
MFKLESYITPILLSYVNKYISNFKTEDSQVSFWGGDAVFNNLELNLQVLEQELHLPFSFVSGSIRELLIHVPWTKLASEPITITINTIECIFNLKGEGSNGRTESVSTPTEKKENKEIEAPQGYVQLLINKIVSNIRIYCNNLILKYVEEDIVLSINVKLLKFESADNKWEPAYIDISPAEVILRKVITINDLTLCLDKRNASGKIEIYMEPMLYKCSMTMHLFKNYHSAHAGRASITRFDIYCNNMEFSMTEQQVPMFMRLLMLIYTLKQKQLGSDTPLNEGTANPIEHGIEDNQTSWSSWAWSYVSSVLPAPWDDELQDEDFDGFKGHTVHFGSYIDNLSITFKVSEASPDRGNYYNAHKKIRYNPMLCLQLQGIYCETIIHGLKWLNSTCGISQAVLLPMGSCSCSHTEIPDHSTAINYLKIGSEGSSHKTDSLFDAEAVENKGQRRMYNTSWDHHMTVYTESVLLDRTPAFCFDYLYQIEVPSDTSSEVLSELGSDFEFSNLMENANMRMCVGPLKLRICSGLFHRIGSLQAAASYYDYPPYAIPKPEKTLQDIHPPSEEDFDALNEFIPTRSMRITFFAPIIELDLMDHPYFQPTKGMLFVRKKKKGISPTSPSATQSFLPKLSIECQFIDISSTYPMYVNRLVHTTCQLPDPPAKLFEACYSHQNVKIVGLCSQLIVNKQQHTTILTPSSFSYSTRHIAKPQFWVNPNIPHEEQLFESDTITLNGTNAKMMVVALIVGKMLKMDSEGALSTMKDTSILSDASKDDMPFMELCIESIRFKRVQTNSTISMDMSLGSIKAFIFEPVKGASASTNDIQQILFISGPDPKPSDNPQSEEFNLPLFTATIQYPLEPDNQRHPPILLFNLQEIRICIDPMLCRWLLYYPQSLLPKQSSEKVLKTKTYETNEPILSDTPRRITSLIETVHSSSDRELFKPVKVESPKEETVDLQEKIYNFLIKWFDVWKGMFICGDISQCTVYFPLVSLSAIGSQGIQEAVESAVNKKQPPDILIITLPLSNVRSAHRQSIKKYLNKLPVTLPASVWSPDTSSFPWTMSVSELSCYTVQFGNKLSFLNPFSLSATVGLSTKSNADAQDSNKIDIGPLGIYIHVDVTPILISTSEVQVYLFASILYGLIEVSENLMPDSTGKSSIPEAISSAAIKDSSVSLTENVIREVSFESLSDQTPTIATNKENPDEAGVKLTAWVQWTITRFTVELLSNDCSLTSDSESSDCRLNLVIDAEDIENWQPGPYTGVVMRIREDAQVNQRHEDNGFINVTITRASCQHAHTLWGAVQKKYMLEPKRTTGSSKPELLSQSRYITEIVVNVQPIDFVLSFNTLRSFYQVIAPVLKIPVKSGGKSSKIAGNALSNFTNQNLPLAYLECQDIRVVLPSKNLVDSLALQDCLVVQIDKISLTPSAVNPICRTPFRPDLYERAAHSRILNVPGSDVEDRQYELNITGISVSTGIWDDVIAAPAMVYKDSTVICGHSVEINLTSDINIALVYQQFSIAACLLKEFQLLVEPVEEKSDSSKPKITFPYGKIEFPASGKSAENLIGDSYKDSGFETSDIRSVNSSKNLKTDSERNFAHKQSISLDNLPIEALFTAGKLTVSFYEIADNMRTEAKDIVLLLDKNKDLKVKEKNTLPYVRPTVVKSKFYEIKNYLYGITNVNFKIDQAVFCIVSDSGHEVQLSFEKSSSSFSITTRPEKISLKTNFQSATLIMLNEMNQGKKNVLLNPWSFSFNVFVFWEPWQHIDCDPQIQVNVKSENIVIDISPETVRGMQTIVKEVEDVVSSNLNRPQPAKRAASEDSIPRKLSEKEQHYKDDLRAGAFQFIDANSDNADELPLPYQVVFWNAKISAMAWRYPQPRALTKIRVFPVPFKGAFSNESQDEIQISCSLQYWSECRTSYLPYAQFYMSESEVCHLKLPKSNPQPVVASTWRVVITVESKVEGKIVCKCPSSMSAQMSPRALAACMRIDSYFNRNLVPNICVSLEITKIDVSLTNNFDKLVYIEPPSFLKRFTSDYLFPDKQKFLTLSLFNVKGHLTCWERDVSSAELRSSAKCTVLDYHFLTEQPFVEPFNFELRLDASDRASCELISKPVRARFGPNVAHTLAVSAQVWDRAWPDRLIVMTRLVVCNDTHATLRFGQAHTDEEVSLGCRKFHLYSWRSQKKAQQLRVGVESNEYEWSEPFGVYEDGTQLVEFEESSNVAVYVSIKSLSATQKKITIFAQLIVANMLMEHFEMKVVEAVKENKDVEFRNTPTELVPSRNTTPSIFLRTDREYYLRLRFYGLDSAWTGDVPLKAHYSGSQPWLVKVPLQERGQFLSIWCRIVTEEIEDTKRILAILWPLFTVKSNLPVSSNVHIETPTLNVHLDSTVEDQSAFFKKSENGDIEENLSALEIFSEVNWPMFGDELDEIDWIVEDQPLTHVQVRYQNASPNSCSLLVELLPWCLAANTLGIPVSLMLNGTELCRIPHHGIVAPPKLEGNFNMGISMGGSRYYSEPLQLAKSDWSQTFYMPTISGTLPIEGSIKAAIKCDSHVCCISVSSTIANEIRLLKISSTHVLTNQIPTQLQVICLAVSNGDKKFNFPKNADRYSFALLPCLDKSQCGVSIIKWYTSAKSSSNSNDYALYMSFCTDETSGWSCPIRVDRPFLRKSFCITATPHPIAALLTCQEHKGQLVLSLFNDNYPQTLIANSTGRTILCGQSAKDGSVAEESQHFNWNCRIQDNEEMYYSMPLLGEKFPELPQYHFPEHFRFACESQNSEKIKWSQPINITHNYEQYLRIPPHGDIKVIVVNSACTTFINLQSTGEMEINASDIRTRLSMNELDKTIQEEAEEQQQEEEAPSSSNFHPEEIHRAMSDSSISKVNNKSQFQGAEDSCPCPRTRSDSILSATSPLQRSLLVSTLPTRERWALMKFRIQVETFTVTFASDLKEQGRERWEIASLICDNVVVDGTQTEKLKMKFSISDVQLDNQLYSRHSYDFPVLLKGQEGKERRSARSVNIPLENLEEIEDNDALITADFTLETWTDKARKINITGERLTEFILA